MHKIVLPLITLLTFSTSLMAENNETEVLEDMSDPLAVYTRGGLGVTNRGLNIKMGLEYKSNDINKQNMHILEIKGFGGEAIGWDGAYERSNSVDSLRYRHVSLDKTDKRGTQIDITYDFHSESGVISYSLLQGLPKWWDFNLYPLAGLGVAYANNALQDDGRTNSGFSVPGVLAVVGLYGRYMVTDNIWINYNPFWTVGLTGSDLFMDQGIEGHSSVVTHEAALSYKLSQRSNIRYFGNWSQYTYFRDGVHRLEYNYQF